MIPWEFHICMCHILIMFISHSSLLPQDPVPHPHPVLPNTIPYTYECKASTREVVLNLWVTTPLRDKWPFHRVHLWPLENILFTVQFITVANLELRSHKENNFMVGVTTPWATLLKDHSIMKVWTTDLDHG